MELPNFFRPFQLLQQYKQNLLTSVRRLAQRNDDRLGLTFCRLFGPLEQAVTAVVILSLAMQGPSSFQLATSHVPPHPGQDTNMNITTGDPAAGSRSFHVASTLIGLVSEMTSHIDTATLALIALVANLLLVTMPDDLKHRLRESWDIFWPPWQDRAQMSSHRRATNTPVVSGEASREIGQGDRVRTRTMDAEPVPRSSKDGTRSREGQSTGERMIPVEGGKARASRESKADKDMVKAAPRQAPEVREEKAGQSKSSHKTRDEVEPPESRSASSRELVGPSGQGADPSEKERAEREAYEKAKREAYERAKAKAPEKSTTKKSEAESADVPKNSAGKDGDGGGAPKMLDEGGQADKQRAKMEAYEKVKREAYEKSRAEQKVKDSSGDQTATKEISNDVADDPGKGRAKREKNVKVGRAANEEAKARRAEVQAKEKGREVPPHMARSEGEGPGESAEQQAKREAYEKAKKRARGESEGDASAQSKKDATKEISVVRDTEKSTKIRTPESEADRLKRKALEKARLEAYEKAKREKGAVQGGNSDVQGASIQEGGPTESEKAQKAKISQASADRPRADAPAASKGEKLEEDIPSKGKQRMDGERSPSSPLVSTRPPSSTSSKSPSGSSSESEAQDSTPATSATSAKSGSETDDPLMAGDYRPLKSALKKSKKKPRQTKNIHHNYFMTMLGGRPALVPFPHGFHPKPHRPRNTLWWDNVAKEADHIMAHPPVPKMPEETIEEDNAKEKEHSEERKDKEKDKEKDKKKKEEERETPEEQDQGKKKEKEKEKETEKEKEKVPRKDRERIEDQPKSRTIETTAVPKKEKPDAVSSGKEERRGKALSRDVPSDPKPETADKGTKSSVEDGNAKEKARIKAEAEAKAKARAKAEAEMKTNAEAKAHATRSLAPPDTPDTPPRPARDPIDPQLQKATQVSQALLCVLLYLVQPELGLALLALFVWQHMKHTDESAIAQRPQPLPTPTPTAVPVARSSQGAERAEQPRNTESGGASSKPARQEGELTAEKRDQDQYERAKAAKRAEAQSDERAIEARSTKSLKIPGEISPEDREKYQRAKAAKGKSDLQGRNREAEPTTPERSTKEMPPELRAEYETAKAAARDKESPRRESQPSAAATPPPPEKTGQMRKEIPKDVSPEAEEKNQNARAAREVSNVAAVRGESTGPKARSTGATSSKREIPPDLQEKYERTKAAKRAEEQDVSSSPGLVQTPAATSRDMPPNGRRHKETPTDDVDRTLSQNIVADQRTASKETSRQRKPSTDPVETKVTKEKINSKAALDKQKEIREGGALRAFGSPRDDPEPVEAQTQQTNREVSTAGQNSNSQSQVVNDGEERTDVHPKSRQGHVRATAGRRDSSRRKADRTHASAPLAETKPGEQPPSLSFDETEKGRGTAKAARPNETAERHSNSVALSEPNVLPRELQSERRETRDTAGVAKRDGEGKVMESPDVTGGQFVKARKAQEMPPEIRAKYERMKAAKRGTQASGSDTAGKKTLNRAVSEHETPSGRGRHDKEGGTMESVEKNSPATATAESTSSASIKPRQAGPDDSGMSLPKDAKDSKLPLATTEPQPTADSESSLSSSPDVRARSGVPPDMGTYHETARAKLPGGSTGARPVAPRQGSGDVGSRKLLGTASSRRRTEDRGVTAKARAREQTVNAETDRKDTRRPQDDHGSDSNPPAYSSMPSTPFEEATASRESSSVDYQQGEPDCPLDSLGRSRQAQSVEQGAVERETGVKEARIPPELEVRNKATKLMKRERGEMGGQDAGPVQGELRQEVVAEDQTQMPKMGEVGLREQHRGSGSASERALSSPREQNGDTTVEGPQDLSALPGERHHEGSNSAPPGPRDHRPAESSPQERSDRESRARGAVGRRGGGGMVRDCKDDKNPRAGRSNERTRAEVQQLTAETPEKPQNEVQRCDLLNSPSQRALPPDHSGEESKQGARTMSEIKKLRGAESDKHVGATKPVLTVELGGKNDREQARERQRALRTGKEKDSSRQEPAQAALGQEQLHPVRIPSQDETNADKVSRQGSPAAVSPRSPKGKEKMTPEMVAKYEKYKALKQDEEAGRGSKVTPDMKERYERLKAPAREKQSHGSRGVVKDEAHHSDPRVLHRLKANKDGSRSPPVSPRDLDQRREREGRKSREPSRRDERDARSRGDGPAKVRLEDLTLEMVEQMQKARDRRRLEKERAAKAGLGQGSSGLSPVEKEEL